MLERLTVYNRIYQTLAFTLCCILSTTVFAWDHSIDLGYGYSHDPNHTRYYNSGVLLTSDLISLYRNCWSFWSINGGLGHWDTTAPHDKIVTTASVDLALRLYTLNIGDNPTYPTYILAAGGPAYLSHRAYGENLQGSHFAFQVFAGLGVELNQLDINFRAVHYSNAGTSDPNDGYNILYLLSFGYLF